MEFSLFESGQADRGGERFCSLDRLGDSACRQRAGSGAAAGRWTATCGGRSAGGRTASAKNWKDRAEYDLY